MSLKNESANALHAYACRVAGTRLLAIRGSVSSPAEVPTADTLAIVSGEERLVLVGKGVDALVEEMKRYLGMGYTTVKMKIGGAPGTALKDALSEDMARIEAVGFYIIDRQDGPFRLEVDAVWSYGADASD